MVSWARRVRTAGAADARWPDCPAALTTAWAGIEALCKDLGLDVSERKVLILAWKMGARRMGYFARDEFCRGALSACARFGALLRRRTHGHCPAGLQRLGGLATTDAVRRALDQADAGLQSSSSGQFQDFHAFAFRYCLTVRAAPAAVARFGPHAHSRRLAQETSQKIIDLDTAIQMLSLTMPTSPHTGPFTEFLAEQTEYKTINMDQWTGYYRFTQEVGQPWHGRPQRSVPKPGRQQGCCNAGGPRVQQL